MNAEQREAAAHAEFMAAMVALNRSTDAELAIEYPDRDASVPPHGVRLLLSMLASTGGMVAMCIAVGHVKGAIGYAEQGVRAARLLGLYPEPEGWRK